MNNKQFLVVVGTLIVILTGFLLLEKYRECFERGYTDCPMRAHRMTQQRVLKGVDPQ
ncbi:MAG: hypothetical protein RO009_12425 [Pseudorhodoplanes sp.]|jgi:hypothetical protein|nr:hypothetical protein [Pseudorhodoplanes sp.]